MCLCCIILIYLNCVQFFRKRKGGIKLEEDNNAEEETNGDAENTELAKKIQEEEAAKKAEKEKKKENDLWSRFLCDVKPAARPPPKASPASTATKQVHPHTIFTLKVNAFKLMIQGNPPFQTSKNQVLQGSESLKRGG